MHLASGFHLELSPQCRKSIELKLFYHRIFSFLVEENKYNGIQPAIKAEVKQSSAGRKTEGGA